MADAPKYSLNFKDVGKAIIMAFLGAFVTAVYTGISAGKFPSLAELGTAALMGLGAALTYLLKNFLTTSNDNFLGKEPLR